MKYLFDEEGLAVLEQLRMARTLYAFDFDGTLCPIVPSPEMAAIPEPVSTRLRELAMIAPVAIISGRRLSDLKARIPFDGSQLLGNHGAEGLLSEEALRDATRTCVGWVRELRDINVNCLEGEDFILENKGISISLHYRHSVNRSHTLASLQAKIAGLDPKPRVIPGKLVLNLVPEGIPHKGTALSTLLSRNRCERALFVGDDVTDEDVFGMQDERVTGVGVTPLPGSNAAFFLKSESEIERLLGSILGGCRRTP